MAHGCALFGLPEVRASWLMAGAVLGLPEVWPDWLMAGAVFGLLRFGLIGS